MPGNDTSMPPFGDARGALSFALNHSTSSIARPAMAKILEEAALSLKEPTDAPSRSTRSQGPARSGTDGAFLAGVVLRYFAKLQATQRLALLARTITPRQRCECHAPCCSGWRIDRDWDAAVEGICFVLKEHANVTRTPGKKGMSTPAVLRRALVERMFSPVGEASTTMAKLAAQAGVTEVTVYAHRKLITDYLEEAEKSGWTELDALLTEANLVGFQG